MEELFSRCLLFHPAAVSKGSSRGANCPLPCEGFGQRGIPSCGRFSPPPRDGWHFLTFRES